MITVISGTNRRGSETHKFAKKYYEILQEKGVEAKFLDLQDIPHDWFFPDMYSADQQAQSVAALQDEYFFGAEKILYVIPEYNGSFPGALKLFIDAISIREYAKNFVGKKAAIAGVASGRAGNLRGIDHLTGVLHHVGSVVMPKALPISAIKSLYDENGAINAETTASMEAYMDRLIAF